ncbi:MAG: Fis family transcriptional regulator [Sulfurimonadaceae bacterium]|jgi:DNA-binding NtrC family response regulator|nr:Fis family transcriptional regulator [Arcobacteraceae bacterium]MDX9795580.1 Fis family transcriptional regulator [Arcobacteraceae bacterium]
MQDYIAASPASKEILNSATLLKSLGVNALISGSTGTGKKSLASYILPNTTIYQAKELQQDISDNILSLTNQSIIVDKIENITNVELFLTWANENDIRVIATTSKEDLNSKLKDFFSITLFIPNLENRKEDIKPLANKFSNEAMQILGANKKPEKLIINTSENAISLRKSIYFSYLFESIGENEIMMLLEKFMLDNMQGENAYRDLVYLFEAPLLRASQKKYKSQLQMSRHLGLNRITLRKKLEIHKDLL